MSGLVILGLIFAGLFIVGLVGMYFADIDPMSAHRSPFKDST